MSNKFKIVVKGFACVVVGIVTVLVMNNPVIQTSNDTAVKPTKAIPVVKVRPQARQKPTDKVAMPEKLPVQIDLSAIVNTNPEAKDDIEDESMLTLSQQGALESLQSALDDNDLERVRRIIAAFRNCVGEGEAVPKIMRDKAVEALQWFGKDATTDMVAFLDDVDTDISQQAFDAVEAAMSDAAMSDYMRSEVLVEIMIGVSDADHADLFLCQLNDMRNSVKVDTIDRILKEGSNIAKEIMAEQVGDYTDEDITIQDLGKWKAMNPDAPEDNEIYGGELSAEE